MVALLCKNHKKTLSQSANISSQDVPKTSPYNIPRASPKDPIWPSWGCLDLTFRRRPNLTFKGHSWEVDSGRPLEDLQNTETWISQVFFLTFLSELIFHVFHMWRRNGLVKKYNTERYNTFLEIPRIFSHIYSKWSILIIQ